MPFLGVSSLDLGRTVHSVAAPFLFVVVADKSLPVPDDALLGRLAPGLHNIGQRGQQPCEDAIEGELRRGEASAALQRALIEIERPVDLDLQRMPVMRRRAIVLGDEAARIGLVAQHPETLASHQLFQRRYDLIRAGDAMPVAQHHIDPAHRMGGHM